MELRRKREKQKQSWKSTSTRNNIPGVTSRQSVYIHRTHLEQARPPLPHLLFQRHLRLVRRPMLRPYVRATLLMPFLQHMPIVRVPRIRLHIIPLLLRQYLLLLRHNSTHILPHPNPDYQPKKSNFGKNRAFLGSPPHLPRGGYPVGRPHPPHRFPR